MYPLPYLCKGRARVCKQHYWTVLGQHSAPAWRSYERMESLLWCALTSSVDICTPWRNAIGDTRTVAKQSYPPAWSSIYKHQCNFYFCTLLGLEHQTIGSLEQSSAYCESIVVAFLWERYWALWVALWTFLRASTFPDSCASPSQLTEQEAITQANDPLHGSYGTCCCKGRAHYQSSLEALILCHLF